MGRTDSNRGRSSSGSVYEILKRPDGSFDIFHNAELKDRSVPDEWLEDQLVKYGVCGKEYRDARRELDELGRVQLVFTSGRIKATPKPGSNS